MGWSFLSSALMTVPPGRPSQTRLGVSREPWSLSRGAPAPPLPGRSAQPATPGDAAGRAAGVGRAGGVGPLSGVAYPGPWTGFCCPPESLGRAQAGVLLGPPTRPVQGPGRLAHGGGTVESGGGGDSTSASQPRDSEPGRRGVGFRGRGLRRARSSLRPLPLLCVAPPRPGSCSSVRILLSSQSSRLFGGESQTWLSDHVLQRPTGARMGSLPPPGFKFWLRPHRQVTSPLCTADGADHGAHGRREGETG